MTTHHDFIRAWVHVGPTPYFGHNPAARRKGSKGPYGVRRKTAKCERYRAEGRRERNAVRALRRHVRLHPSDTSAVSALARLGG